MDLHRRAELRSLAFHRAIATRVTGDPAILERARRRVAGWEQSGATHPHWASVWSRVLALPMPELAASLVDEGELMTAARQSSPFAGVLSARERWNLWRTAGAEP